MDKRKAVCVKKEASFENRFDSFKTSPMSAEIRQTLCFRGLVLDLINTRVSVLGTNNVGPGLIHSGMDPLYTSLFSLLLPPFPPPFHPADGESCGTA